MSGWDLIAPAKGFRQRVKRSGDRGKPCLVLLDMGNDRDVKEAS